MIDLYLSTDGKHTVHVSAETAEVLYKLAPHARALYETVVKNYGNKAQMWQGAITGKATEPKVLPAMAVPQPAAAKPADGAPLCPVHHRPMAYRQGRRGAFWSCPARYDDGSWCRNTQNIGAVAPKPKGGESREVYA
jgi:hypothetical protein